MKEITQKEKFIRYLRENNVWPSWERLDYFFKLHFHGLSLDNRSLLEIGAGSGLFSAWCSVNGAGKVVAIEPEADGSTTGMAQEFKKLARTVEPLKIIYLPISFEAYFADHKGEKFDYVLMHAVINHINEKATKKLHLETAQAEKQSYLRVFNDIFAVLNPEGILLVYDVGRRNFWHDLRLKNPFAPSIEYEKHQQPHVWRKLLEQVGFEFIDLRWPAIFKLSRFNCIFSWWLPSYLTNSGFIIRFKRPKL